MKRFLLFVFFSLMVCTPFVYGQKNYREDCAEVIYFYGKQRCVTCKAIEQYSKELIDKDFSKELKSGKVIFKSVDISTREGKKLADSYRVASSSLFVNKWKGGKEVRNNFTQTAFKYARTKPDEFKKQLKLNITEALK